jgi:hypothetical protein
MRARARPAKVESGFASGRALNYQWRMTLSPNRFAGSCACVPNLKFAIQCGARLANFGFERTPVNNIGRVALVQKLSFRMRLKHGENF